MYLIFRLIVINRLAHLLEVVFENFDLLLTGLKVFIHLFRGVQSIRGNLERLLNSNLEFAI